MSTKANPKSRINVYEYIVLSSPLEAAKFLAAKGYICRTPKPTEGTQAAASQFVNDASVEMAADLKSYANKTGTKGLTEILETLHPDREVFKEMYEVPETKLNCGGCHSADGTPPAAQPTPAPASATTTPADPITMPTAEKYVAPPVSPSVQEMHKTLMTVGITAVAVIVLINILKN